MESKRAKTVEYSNVVTWLKDNYCSTISSEGRIECSRVLGSARSVWSNLSDRQIGKAIRKAFPIVRRIRSNSIYYYKHLLQQNQLPYSEGLIRTQKSTASSATGFELKRELLCYCRGKYSCIQGDSSMIHIASYEQIPVAVKQFSKGTGMDRIEKERDAAIELGPHECLPMLLGVCVETEPLCIIYKLYGSYEKQLSTSLCQSAFILPSLPSKVWVPFIIKLAESIAYIHSKGHVHGNLNGDHIVVHKEKGILYPKLVGLGHVSRIEASNPDVQDMELIALGQVVAKIFQRLSTQHPSLRYLISRICDPLNKNRPNAVHIAERFQGLLDDGHFG